METLIQEIDVEELAAIFNIPEEMRNSRVEVTIRPIEKATGRTTAEKIEQFRKKYNHGIFVEHLKKEVIAGHAFDFDVQKVIDGTETEEEKQARYRLEKQTWGNLAQERKQRGGE
jgi:hypothetical protein